jgi:hypothetical protein
MKENCDGRQGSVSIEIGGNLPAERLDDFTRIIGNECLSTEWDGPAFALSDLPTGEPLRLMAHEVAWGRLDLLAAFCVEQGLPFARWSGAYPGLKIGRAPRRSGPMRGPFLHCAALSRYEAIDGGRATWPKNATKP